MAAKNILAKALYDNIAETADELEFHRGDIVTVLERNTSGLEGWWLCSLNGHQGIAPGNRLRLVTVIPQQQNQSLSDEDEEYDIPKRQYPNQNNNNNEPSDVYDVPTTRKWGSKSKVDNDEDEVYDVPPTPQVLRISRENLLTSFPQHRTVQIEQEVYDVPSSLMATGNENNSFFSNSQDPSEVYDVPPCREMHAPEEVYDVPLSNKVADSVLLDMSAMLEQEEEEDDEYDIPRGGNDTIDGRISMNQVMSTSNGPAATTPESPDIIYDIPKSSQFALDRSAMENSLNLSNISANVARSPPTALQKQESEDYVYDVPPQVTRDQPPPSSQLRQEAENLDIVIKRLSLVEADGQLQERKSVSSVESISGIIAANEKFDVLNIEHASAIDMLIKLKQSLEDSVSNLLTHVYEGWRQKENIAGKIGDIKEVFEMVLSAVSKFVKFAGGSMANANSAFERGLSKDTPRRLISGMHKLLQPLEEDNMMLQQAIEALNQSYWSLNKLVSAEANVGVPDEIDSFVMTSRAVSDDARQMAAYIHTHSQYLFKQVETKVNPMQRKEQIEKERRVIQTRPLPDVPPVQQSKPSVPLNPTNQNEESWLEDYDYVSLEEQDEVHGSGTQVIGISNEVRIRHKEVLGVLEMSNQKHGVPLIINKNSNGVHGDQFTLQDMVDDVPLLVDSLVAAIKQFYASIDNSDPPKTFVALSKQVILCAHELVFFGDTLYRRLQHQKMQDMVKAHCTQLCTALKRTVAATKHAAQQWPSALAVQEMVDRVTDITASTHQFRILLSQCSVR